MKNNLKKVLDLPKTINGKLPMNNFNSMVEGSEQNIAKWTGTFYTVSAFVILSYVAYGNDAFSENLWLVTLEYFIIFSFFIWELFKSKFYFRLNNTK